MLYRTFYFELSHRVFVVSHGYVGGNIEWETEHAILHRRKLFRYPATLSANRRAKPIAPSETTKMQYTPYILPLILADLLAADGGPAAKLQTLAEGLRAASITKSSGTAATNVDDRWPAAYTCTDCTQQTAAKRENYYF